MEYIRQLLHEARKIPGLHIRSAEAPPARARNKHEQEILDEILQKLYNNNYKDPKIDV
jgi:hypothetical protein